MWKGLAICAALSGGGYALARLAGGGISPLVFALALGVLVGNLPLRPDPRPLEAGLRFATRWLLRGGIVLFGLSVTLQQVLALGPGVLLLDFVVIATILVAGFQIGTRWLGLDRETALLISAGSAICGAADGAAGADE